MKINFKPIFKSISLLLSILIYNTAIHAQQNYPARLIADSKRNSCFLYALGESPFNTGVKVMIISTYVYRHKYEDYHVFDKYGNASTSYYGNLINAFNKKLRDVEHDEAYYHTTATGSILNGNLILRASKIEAFLDQTSGLASGFCPTKNTNQPGVNYTSATDFSENCRERFIDEKRLEGYKVFQIKFDEYYTTSDTYNELFSEKEFNEAKDEVRALSPLYVEYYHAGDIKNLPGYKAANTNSSSSSSSKSTTTSKSKTTSSSSSNTETAEQLQARMNLKMTQAYNLERKGDEYYRMGSLFYKQAYDSYKQSYQMYPLASVQKKIENMENMMKLAKAVDKFGNKVDDAVYNTDPLNKTNLSLGFIQYNGLLGVEKQTNSKAIYQMPSDIWFGVTGQRLFLSLQARMGYMQTGNAEVRVHRTFRGSNAPEQIVDSILINNAGLGLGLSAGINIPIKRAHLYGLYGYEFRMDIAGNLHSDAFRFNEKKDVNGVLPMMQRRIEFGLNVKIPKSSVGFGINYTLLSLKTTGEVPSSRLMKLNPSTADADGTNLYYLDSFSRSRYNYSNVGVKFFWMLN